mmetsp:Transcript_8855/g.15076  ORF Transcript_8855/g.15076 Transcript_8855/m.15076 type:complete len:232 (-) Transcript_8855:1427-2122(-)
MLCVLEHIRLRVAILTTEYLVEIVVLLGIRRAESFYQHCHLAVLDHAFFAVLGQFRLAEGAHTHVHTNLAFHVLHVVVQFLSGQLLSLQVLVQLCVVLLHHLGLRQFRLHGLLKRLRLFGSAQGLFYSLLEVSDLHVRGTDLLRILCLHLRQLTTETINVPVLGFAHLIMLVFQLITLLRKVLFQVVQIGLQTQFGVLGCILESTQFLVVLRVALALLHRTLLRGLLFSHD